MYRKLKYTFMFALILALLQGSTWAKGQKDDQKKRRQELLKSWAKTYLGKYDTILVDSLPNEIVWARMIPIYKDKFPVYPVEGTHGDIETLMAAKVDSAWSYIATRYIYRTDMREYYRTGNLKAKFPTMELEKLEGSWEDSLALQDKVDYYDGYRVDWAIEGDSVVIRDENYNRYTNLYFPDEDSDHGLRDSIKKTDTYKQLRVKYQGKDSDEFPFLLEKPNNAKKSNLVVWGSLPTNKYVAPKTGIPIGLPLSISKAGQEFKKKLGPRDGILEEFKNDAKGIHRIVWTRAHRIKSTNEEYTILYITDLKDKNKTTLLSWSTACGDYCGDYWEGRNGNYSQSYYTAEVINDSDIILLRYSCEDVYRVSIYDLSNSKVYPYLYGEATKVTEQGVITHTPIMLQDSVIYEQVSLYDFNFNKIKDGYIGGNYTSGADAFYDMYPSWGKNLTKDELAKFYSIMFMSDDMRDLNEIRNGLQNETRNEGRPGHKIISKLKVGVAASIQDIAEPIEWTNLPSVADTEKMILDSIKKWEQEEHTSDRYDAYQQSEEVSE